MLTADMSHAKNLNEYHSDLTQKQIEHHGDGYCDVHAALLKYMKNCDTYKELGVKQGTTAAAVILSNPKSVELIDKRLTDYNPHKKHFEKYCFNNNIKFRVREIDSTSFLATDRSSDLLYIDTWHVYAQLQKELNLHHAFVNKYIVMHDTHAKPELTKAIKEFLKTNSKWKMIEENKVNVGYTVLEKVK